MSPTDSTTHHDPTTRRASRPQQGQQRSGHSLTHVEPRPLLDPIREVKRHSIHWKRKVFHVLGVGAAALTYALTSVTALNACLILGSIAAIFVTLDVLRFFVPSLNKKVKRDFGPFMRDYELDGISGSSWFFIAGLITIAAFYKPAAALGMLYLAVGDPIASAVGVKWGRIKLPGGKSLEGSLALTLICALAGTALLTLRFGYAPYAAAGVACVAALAAAFAEWCPINKKMDDNFTVPIFTGGVASLALLAAGLV
ncbi:MAG: diacylglycerol/polyprenol kinase family protein [Planctomycetota bacterium]